MKLTNNKQQQSLASRLGTSCSFREGVIYAFKLGQTCRAINWLCEVLSLLFSKRKPDNNSTPSLDPSDRFT